MMGKTSSEFLALLSLIFKNQNKLGEPCHLALSGVKNSYLMKKVIYEFSALLV